MDKKEKLRRRITDSFNLADITQVGKLDRYMFHVALQYFGFALTNAEFEETFKPYKKDGVSLEDYTNVVESMMGSLVKANDIIAKIKRFDSLDRGYLKVSELRHILVVSKEAKSLEPSMSMSLSFVDNSEEGLTEQEFVDFIHRVREQNKVGKGPGMQSSMGEDDGRIEYSAIVNLLTRLVPSY